MEKRITSFNKVLGAVTVLMFFGVPSSARSEEYSGEQPLETQALQLIQDGKIKEGLEVFDRITKYEPKNPVVRLNYGSILLVEARECFTTDRKTAEKWLDTADKELLVAIRTADYAKEDPAEPLRGPAFIKSQASFLLGEIYAHYIVDHQKAKRYYRQAIQYFPKHPEAAQALKLLEENR